MTFLLLALKFWRECIIAVLAFLLLICLFLLNSKTGKLEQADAKCIAQIQKIELKQQGDLITAQSKVREAEQKAARKVSEIESKLHEQNTKASADQAKLLNDVRSGTVSLRDRFTCPATQSIGVPATPTSTSGDHGAEKRGLQREDAEFLVSESERADEVVRQLTACQAMLVQERSNEKALK